MGRVKINFFDVLDNYEYWKGKCVKSVLGEFSSGVSICRNKGAQSDLGAPFLSGTPRRRGMRGLPPALVIRSDTSSGFFKHVQALLQFQSCFFSHGIKLRGSPLSAVTVSLHYLFNCQRCLSSTATCGKTPHAVTWRELS